MCVSGEARRDGFCSFQIVVNLCSVEEGEDAFSAGVHEVFIDVVHAVVHDDVPHPSGLVALDFLLFV